MHRRLFLSKIAILGAAGMAAWMSMQGSAMGFFGKDRNRKGKVFPFQLSDAEWRERLSPEQYYVLRDHGTERAFTSPLNEEKRNGSYFCSGCGHELFSSAHKYDSGTGWPSFWQPAADGVVGTSVDYRLIVPRTEVHCANCGGHQGHVFEDGPQPTGLRYCINGVALRFVAKDA